MDVCAPCSASTGEKFSTTAAGAEAMLFVMPIASMFSLIEHRVNLYGNHRH
jgi:hypothetical protein